MKAAMAAAAEFTWSNAALQYEAMNSRAQDASRAVDINNIEH